MISDLNQSAAVWLLEEEAELFETLGVRNCHPLAVSAKVSLEVDLALLRIRGSDQKCGHRFEKLSLEFAAETGKFPKLLHDSKNVDSVSSTPDAERRPLRGSITSALNHLTTAADTTDNVSSCRSFRQSVLAWPPHCREIHHSNSSTSQRASPQRTTLSES